MIDGTVPYLALPDGRSFHAIGAPISGPRAKALKTRQKCVDVTARSDRVLTNDAFSMRETSQGSSLTGRPSRRQFFRQAPSNNDRRWP